MKLKHIFKYLFSLNPSEKIIIFSITITLFIIPFFWISPGEMDLGGDASRLYFYDPLGYLKNAAFYNISPQGTGPEFSYQFGFVFSLFLLLLKKVFVSSSILISILNGVTLACAFLSMYLILKELIQPESKTHKTALFFIGILVSLFYIFSPISVNGGWERALFDHSQLFLNPMMFLLFLKYIHTQKINYLLFGLLLTFIFSPNFSYSAAPKFFSFYPFALIFLGVYTYCIKKSKINLKQICIIFVLFVMLHSFHLIPQISNLLESSSHINSKVLSQSGKIEAVNYFMSLVPIISPVENLLAVSPRTVSYLGFDYVSFIFPALVILGAIFSLKKEYGKKYRRSLLLLLSFFLVIFFLITGNVTNQGISIYKSLFYIPSFAMFRSFYGQWAHVYLFFYSLILGYSLFFIFLNISQVKKIIIFVFVISILLVSGLPLITGKIINGTLQKKGGEKVSAKFKIDPQYEQILSAIKTIQSDSKILTFPFVDHFYYLLRGENKGIYIGPSLIAYLSGKNDFGSTLILAPYTDLFLQTVKEKRYDLFKKIFSLYSIRYVFYNSDVKIYDDFPEFPYQHVKQYMPRTQKEYLEFIKSLSLIEKERIGTYHLYEVPAALYVPHIYIAENVKFFPIRFNSAGNLYDIKLLEQNNFNKREVIIDTSYEKLIHISNSVPSITFKKINRTKYKIHVHGASVPYLLVFSEAYNPDWKLFLDSYTSSCVTSHISYFKGSVKEIPSSENFSLDTMFETQNKKVIADGTHVMANAYANAWYIKPHDTNGQKEYTLILEMSSQKQFYMSAIISGIGFAICVIWICMILSRSNKLYVKKNI